MSAQPVPFLAWSRTGPSHRSARPSIDHGTLDGYTALCGMEVGGSDPAVPFEVRSWSCKRCAAALLALNPRRPTSLGFYDLLKLDPAAALDDVQFRHQLHRQADHAADPEGFHDCAECGVLDGQLRRAERAVAKVKGA